jgi:hypothetical protein
MLGMSDPPPMCLTSDDTPPAASASVLPGLPDEASASQGQVHSVKIGKPLGLWIEMGLYNDDNVSWIRIECDRLV